MAEQKTLDLLWNCAKSLSTETHTERLLKSYYITTCRKLAKHNVQLPGDSFGPARMCSRCGNQWTDGQYRLHLKSQRLAETAKRRRQIAQLDEAKQKGLLSRSARKRAKWLKKRMASKMAVDCSLCRHKTMLCLEKPKKQNKAKTIATPVEPEPAPVLHKKKKNKKKPKDMPAPATTTKKKTKAAQPTPTPSKTQKQNSLLQLAAQLKQQAFKNASETPQNRLQAFLK